MVGKKGKIIRARPSPPPFRAMPERNQFFLWEVFPNEEIFRFIRFQSIFLFLLSLEMKKLGEKFNFQGQKRASVKAKKGGLKQKFKVICQFF